MTERCKALVNLILTLHRLWLRSTPGLGLPAGLRMLTRWGVPEAQVHGFLGLGNNLQQQ
jgi:hypothetical protein